MLVIFVFILSLILGGYSLEPKCSKFAYDEQLLEKMIRMEVNTEKKEETYKAERDEIMKTIAALNTRIETLEADKIGLRGFAETGFEKMSQKTSNQVQTFETLLSGFSQTVLNNAKSRDDTVVAFSANTAKNKNPNKGEIIVFTTVTMNEGSPYDNTTGKFTAPVDGVYIFHDQICLKSKMDFYHTYVVDDTDMTRERYVNTDSDSSYPVCFTTAFTQLLKAEQKVSVKCKYVNKNGERLIDDDHRLNMFSGVLVREI